MTSDLHAELRDFDYMRLRPDPTKGLSRAAALITRLRRDAPTHLLVDCGDFLHGRPFAALPDRGVHAVAATMETLAYDAVTLGNHDFDGGVTQLEMALAGRRLPVVTGNILERETGDGLFPRYRLVSREVIVNGTRRWLTVGLTGMLPPQALTGVERMAWDRLDVRDPEEVAEGLINDIYEAGADIVVSLCHDGPRTARILARAGSDAIAMGHMHEAFPGPAWPASEGVDPVAGRIKGVPAVMPTAMGRSVGTMDLRLFWSAQGWRALAGTVAVHEIATQDPPLAPDQGVLNASRSVHAAALVEAQRTVAQLDVPLHSYFARLGRCRATRLVAAAAAQEVREKVKGGPLADLPIVGLAAPVLAGGLGGARNFVDIPPGALTTGDLRDLTPHGDRVWGVVGTVDDLRLWLERTVSGLRQVIPGQMQPELLDEDFPSASFDLPDRATFSVDLTQPAAYTSTGASTGHPPSRVRDLHIAGRALMPDTPILLAVTEHRIRGGGAFPVPAGTQRIETKRRSDDALAEYLEAGLPLPQAQVFTILPVPHAIAAYRTGQGARAFPGEAAALGLTRNRRGVGGWDVYRMPLDSGA